MMSTKRQYYIGSQRKALHLPEASISASHMLLNCKQLADPCDAPCGCILTKDRFAFAWIGTLASVDTER